MKRRFIYLICVYVILMHANRSYSQCCSGGSGSPVAGGASQGVLKAGQIELNQNYQLIQTGRSLTGDHRSEDYIEKFSSHYLYTRVGAGLSKRLSVSAELGIYPAKTQYGYQWTDTFRSRGVSDLLIFPRYNVLNAKGKNCNSEITLGMGVKFPLGKYQDSLNFFTNPVTGQKLFIRKPLAVQPTNGSVDVIGYGFFYRGIPAQRMRLFATLLYIRKGWNPLGEHFGDYFNVGLFAGKTFFQNISGLLQFRTEWIGQMKRAPGLLMPPYDPNSTGSFKVFFTPQVSVTFFGRLTWYYLQDIPLYQHANGTQVATTFQATTGLSYRFMLPEKKMPKEECSD